MFNKLRLVLVVSLFVASVTTASCATKTEAPVDPGKINGDRLALLFR